MVTIQYHPGTWDQQISREAMVPEARQQSGCKGAMLLVDHATRTCRSITLWQTEARAQATRVGCAHSQTQGASVVSQLAAEPTVATYKVAFNGRMRAFYSP